MLRRNRFALPNWLGLLLGLTILLTSCAVSVFIFFTADAVWGMMQQPFNPLESAAVEVAGTALPPLMQDGEIALVELPPSVATVTPPPTSIPVEDDRVTILLMGIDRRPGQAFISRTDTMMLASVNTQDNSVSLLSIPRDLYVVIPGHGRDRINTAFVYGSGGNNPAGGATLAMQTVEYNLGVPVDHYFMVDFNAFTKTIDALGGIDVVVPYDINDPTYPSMDYGFDPLYIPAGYQHFDGATALKYARTRHQDNDFYRAQRQQQIILAVRSKILGLGVAEMIRQGPALYARVTEGTRTDMSLEEMLQLANVLKDVTDEDLRNEVLDYDYVTSYTTEAGASVLVLINELAAPLIEEMFLAD